MFEMTRSNAPVSLANSRDSDGGILEFLEIRLMGEAFAFELTQVLEIQNKPRITPVPRAPADVLGIFSVRGRLLTLIDLPKRLGLARAGGPPQSGRVLLTQSSEGEVIGLLVDEVIQVVRLMADDIEATHTVFGSDSSEFAVGIARPGGQAIVLLDMRSVAR